MADPKVVLDRMQREYGVKVRTGRPRVVYRESVAAENRGQMALDLSRTEFTVRSEIMSR